jgi:hypothetical protein
MPGLAGGVLAGDQSEIRPDGRSGEAGPVADLHGKTEPGRELDAAEAHQCVDDPAVTAGRGRNGNLFIDASQVRGEYLFLLKIRFVGELQGPVHYNAGGVAIGCVPLSIGCHWVTETLPQQDGAHVLAGVCEVIGRAGTKPVQILQGFCVRVGDPYLNDRIEREHISEHPGVPPVSFHLLSGSSQQF